MCDGVLVCVCLSVDMCGFVCVCRVGGGNWISKFFGGNDIRLSFEGG